MRTLRLFIFVAAAAIRAPVFGAGIEQVVSTSSFGSVLAVAFSPDGKTVAAGGGNLTLIRCSDGKLERTLPVSGGDVVALAFNGKGDRLAVATRGGLLLFDPSDGRLVRAVKLSSGQLAGIAFSSDGKKMAGSGTDSFVRVLDASDFHEIGKFQNRGLAVRSLSFSPSGAALAGALGSRVMIWDLDDPAKSFDLSGHRGTLTAVQFQSGGERIASGGTDTTVAMWDIKERKQAYIDRTHKAAVTSVAFGGDGKMLASGSSDKTIVLRNAETGQLLCRVRGFKQDVLAVALSGNAEYMACGSRSPGEYFKLWRLSPQALYDGYGLEDEDYDEITGEYMSDAEREVIAETNRARADPKRYAEQLKKFRSTHQGGGVFLVSGRRIASKEGLAAVDEAIAFLEKEARPCPALSGAKGLWRAALDHVRDTGPAGITGHDGTDGSNSAQRMSRHGEWQQTCGENIAYGCDDPKYIVMQLIVDDGVPDRGHRKNIFNGAYRMAGVSMGRHKQYGVMCCIDYAGGYKDKR